MQEVRRTGHCSKMGPSTQRRDCWSRDDASTATGTVNHLYRSHFLLAVEIISLSAWFNDWFNCRACSLPLVGVISHQHPGNLAQANAASRISGHMSVINSAVIKNMSLYRRLLRACVSHRCNVLVSLSLQQEASADKKIYIKMPTSLSSTFHFFTCCVNVVTKKRVAMVVWADGGKKGPML